MNNTEIIQEAKDDLKSLRAFCVTSYQHLLKWEYNKDQQSISWIRSIHESILNISKMAGYNSRSKTFKGNYINYFRDNQIDIFNDAIHAANVEGNNIDPKKCGDVLSTFNTLYSLIDREVLFSWMLSYAKDLEMKSYCMNYMKK